MKKLRFQIPLPSYFFQKNLGHPPLDLEGQLEKPSAAFSKVVSLFWIFVSKSFASCSVDIEICLAATWDISAILFSFFSDFEPEDLLWILMRTREGTQTGYRRQNSNNHNSLPFLNARIQNR